MFKKMTTFGGLCVILAIQNQVNQANNHLLHRFVTKHPIEIPSPLSIQSSQEVHTQEASTNSNPVYFNSMLRATDFSVLNLLSEESDWIPIDSSIITNNLLDPECPRLCIEWNSCGMRRCPCEDISCVGVCDMSSNRKLDSIFWTNVNELEDLFWVETKESHANYQVESFNSCSISSLS